MKANGIGRPSTRANIIETLFRRKYALRNKKQVIPTEMGIQLINTIQNQLLKSAELTGQWEKQLKEIEQGEYSAKQFIFNMKKMVDEMVYEVRSETGKPRLSTAVKTPAKKAPALAGLVGTQCPKCTDGRILKGQTSYGCHQYKAGCDFRVPFWYLNKKLTEKQVQRLIEKKVTTKIIGFLLEGQKVDGILKLNAAMAIEFENKTPAAAVQPKNDMPPCPKCGKGKIIKGRSAYGCSQWKSGCDFRFAFNDIKTKANGRSLTKELVLEIIKN
jgi:DNA topoisomerase-3